MLVFVATPTSIEATEDLRLEDPDGKASAAGFLKKAPRRN